MLVLRQAMGTPPSDCPTRCGRQPLHYRSMRPLRRPVSKLLRSITRDISLPERDGWDLRLVRSCNKF